MKTSKPHKKKVILILWGFLLLIIVIVFLTILLLSLQTKPSNKQEPVSNVKTNSQQEQETYNRLMSKIEKEIDDLTKKPESSESNLLKYPPKTRHYTNGAILEITEYNQNTGKPIKESVYYENTGKIKTIVDFDENGKWKVVHRYDEDTGKLKSETFYNPDGTIKETKTY